MVFSTPERVPTAAKSSSTGLLASITALVALFGRATRKLRTKQSSPRSRLARPKHVLKTISQSAITLVHKKKTKPQKDQQEEEEWGHGGVWQRAILMGDKCQPLDFSGAIYYDNNGNKMDQLPLRSPRASPLPGYLLAKTAS